MPLLQRFHYDTAQVANPAAMAALTKVVPTSQILFGTDFPFRTSLDHVKGLNKSSALKICRRSRARTPAHCCPGCRRFETFAFEVNIARLLDRGGWQHQRGVRY